MSVFDITTKTSLAVDRYDYYELNGLSLVTDIRDKKDSDDIEEYRISLKVSGHWLIKDITTVLVPFTNITTVDSLDFRISGGEKINITQDPDMSRFLLMSQEILPEQGQGWGVNRINDDWVSTADKWHDLNWNAAIVYPATAVVSNSVSTTYTSVVSTENTSIWNDTREKEDGTEQYRTRVKTTQFYDADDITAINGLYPTPRTIATLHPTGYNDDSEVGVDLAPSFFTYNWLLTEFSVEPIEKIGGTMARIKYTWDNWGIWIDF